MRILTAPAAAALSAGLLLSTVGCASSPPRQQALRGRLTIGVTTSGSSARAATFRLTVEPAGISGTVKADAGVFVSDDLPPGDHLVRLHDVPPRCRVEGGTERKVAISPQRRSVVLRFDVDCGG
jgi:hypothetical protein